MKHKYIYKSHISEVKFRKIIKCFANDLTSSSTASLLNINRKTIDRIFLLIRKRLFKKSICTDKMGGSFELDESYFGAKRVRGKRGRGAAGKTPVFGVLKRDGDVYITIVKNCSKAELMPIIEGKILENSVIYTDGWKAYDGLILNGYEHYRVYHSNNEFARGKSHVNGIESFWSFCKRRLSKLNGMSTKLFYLYLKESEFRFNHRHENLYMLLLLNVLKTERFFRFNNICNMTS